MYFYLVDFTYNFFYIAKVRNHAVRIYFFSHFILLQLIELVQLKKQQI